MPDFCCATQAIPATKDVCGYAHTLDGEVSAFNDPHQAEKSLTTVREKLERCRRMSETGRCCHPDQLKVAIANAEAFLQR